LLLPSQWVSFCRVLGQPVWAADPRYADAASRYRHQDALDAHLAAWTQKRHPWEIMTRLQQAGSTAEIAELRAEGHIGMDFLGREDPNASNP
jgi:CoA:oxalate CoA-transferase